MDNAEAEMRFKALVISIADESTGTVFTPPNAWDNTTRAAWVQMAEDLQQQRGIKIKTGAVEVHVHEG
jgi:hypothetical protein